MSTEYRKAQAQINEAIAASFAAAGDDELKAWAEQVTMNADPGAQARDDASFDAAWDGYLTRMERQQSRGRKQ